MRYKMVLKDSYNILDLQIYTISYKVDGEAIGEKVLAYDYEDAKNIIIDSYEDDVNIEFSPYNPIRIESVEDFLQDALEREHILRR